MGLAGPAKSGSVRSLLLRSVLFGVSILLLRFVYVVTVSGGGPAAEPLAVAGTVGGARAFALSGHGSAAWTSREWRKAVEFYSPLFQELVSEGYLSPASKALCVGSAKGYEVLALKEIGVTGAVGVARKAAPPLVVAGGEPLRMGVQNNTFDFVFVDQALDAGKPGELAKEIARVLKVNWYLVVLSASAGDAYSLGSLAELFPGFVIVRSRQVDGLDSSKILREIVLQKVEEGEIVGPNENSNKCLNAEHKLRILRSAEPLIEEEPLKPWIALKRNIKNVKYLPSIADISFKSRYVYVDVGARSYGSSIGSWFRKQYPKQNHTFDVYAIEADKAFYEEYAKKKGVTLLPFAAWVRNESLTFEINRGPEHHDDEAKGKGMGRIRPVGGSSGSVSSGEARTIRAFDFAAWLKRTVTQRDYVVMKMDIEGTEFELLPRLFETGAICLIDELFLECHYNRWQKCCPGVRSPKYEKTYGQCLDLFNSLRENGVLVHQWW